MFVHCPIFSGWVRHSLHFTKSIPTEYHLLSSRFPSSLCQIAKSSLRSHQAHFCQIVHFISPSSPTPHHQCYVANSPNPLDCPKCSSNFPGLKFCGLPNTWNVFLFCHQQRRLPNFRNALKPLYFPHLMAIVSFESNPFKRAPLEIYFLIAFWGQVFSLNFMFLLANSIFINSVQFKLIERDANASINHYPNEWWVKLIDQMEKQIMDSNTIFVHGRHQFWWKNLIPLIGYIYIYIYISYVQIKVMDFYWMWNDPSRCNFSFMDEWNNH